MEEAATKEEVKELGSKGADLRPDLAEALKATRDKVVTGTAEWTKAHPLAALAIAAGLGAGIGFAIGMLVGRHRS